MWLVAIKGKLDPTPARYISERHNTSITLYQAIANYYFDECRSNIVGAIEHGVRPAIAKSGFRRAHAQGGG